MKIMSSSIKIFISVPEVLPKVHQFRDIADKHFGISVNPNVVQAQRYQIGQHSLERERANLRAV